MTKDIPGPYAWPVVGNLFDLKSSEGGSRAQENLADTYGPVYQVTAGGRKVIVVSTAEILKQVTDEKQFIKIPPSALSFGKRPRALFVARSDDPDWMQAHRILMPAFGPLSVENMFGEMKDIASQLCLKWARAGEESHILLTDDFTRLTLDTIALCAMDYRFNSFYQDSMHPFVAAMVGVLSQSGKRHAMPWILNQFMGDFDQQKLNRDNEMMRSTGHAIIDYRRQHPTARDDLLNTMLFATDPKTGEKMRDELISSNMIGFLIAGHETTSGLLSFTFMQLLQNPATYLKAQKEVDTIIGAGTVEPKHLKEMKYLNAVLRETLRLTPTAPAVTKVRHPDHKDEPTQFQGTDFWVEPETPIRVLLGKAMADPSYFGEDASVFNPDRMMEDNPNFDRYMKAWKPFGNGSRACIGQNLAWQEALLATALILQNFNMHFVDPHYQMHIQQTLTVKPKDLYVQLKLRQGLTATSLIDRLYGQPQSDHNHTLSTQNGIAGTSATMKSEKKILILYGSNSGTCQALAQRLASAAASRLGMETCIQPLDAAVDNLPKDEPVIVVTSSYEGQPPDNAARFVEWLESTSTALDHITFAVFGCGDSNWHDTFHRIPKLVDQTLEKRGAKRIHAFGSCDVSTHNVMDDFTKWLNGLLDTISGIDGVTSTENVPDLSSQAEIHTDERASKLSDRMLVARVRKAYSLTGPGQSEKRHLEVELPEDSTYECGDYLAVLPVNPDILVKRILSHWRLPWDATILLKSKAFPPLPEGVVLSIYDVLKGYFELGQPMSKTDMERLKHFTQDTELLKELDGTLQDEELYASTITKERVSLFSYLTLHPGIEMPFLDFLSSLLPLSVRQYSISSSPMVDSVTCTITYSVVQDRSPDSDDPFEGVASTYLAGLKAGDSIQMSLKRTATANSKTPFRLPVDKETPMLLYCAGTGLAPFRGFIQQRAFMLERNKDLYLAPAILFVGCRTSTEDRLYADEFDHWAALGAVDIRYAFSQEPEKSSGCKYISDRMMHDRKDIAKLWAQGAKAYICGSRRVMESVKDVGRQVFEKETNSKSVDHEQPGDAAFKQVLSERVVSDIFD